MRDRVINHAVRQAYEALLPAGRYAAYVLYLEIDPQEVDVNVHPTKHEVRFAQSRLVHDFIVSSLQKVLLNKTVTVRESVLPAPVEKPDVVKENLLIIQSLPLLGVAHDTHALFETQDGIAVLEINMLAAHFLAKQWAAQWMAEGFIGKKRLLIPLQVRLSAQEAASLMSISDTMQLFGLEYTALGDETLLLRCLPEGLKGIRLDAALVEWAGEQGVFDEGFFFGLARMGEAEHRRGWLSQVDESVLEVLSPVRVGFKH